MSCSEAKSYLARVLAMGLSCPLLSVLMPGLQDKLSRHLESGEITAKEVAAGILGERCWIKWPYLQEAVVVAVSDGKQTVSRQMLSLREFDQPTSAAGCCCVGSAKKVAASLDGRCRVGRSVL